mmetsp:Transcript_135440/g.289637  ORF Transcript_135440/g.289637 Transcript_135440/m.289637 type:complete len:238 (+) Transcript_135440:1222-1935(+)
MSTGHVELGREVACVQACPRCARWPHPVGGLADDPVHPAGGEILHLGYGVAELHALRIQVRDSVPMVLPEASEVGSGTILYAVGVIRGIFSEVVQAVLESVQLEPDLRLNAGRLLVSLLVPFHLLRLGLLHGAVYISTQLLPGFGRLVALSLQLAHDALLQCIARFLCLLGPRLNLREDLLLRSRELLVKALAEHPELFRKHGAQAEVHFPELRLHVHLCLLDLAFERREHGRELLV